MAAISPPRRGGDHPIYGIFLGGNELDNDYKLLGSRHYKFTGQRRGPKVVNSIEQTLHSLSNSKDSEKFTGKLETTPSANTNEIDKERFIKLLRKRVRLHGQQSFYAMTYGQAVVPLFDNYHKFTVEEVIEQHKDRCEEPSPDFDANGVETKDSESLRFVAYDDYEFDEFGLSRLVVESLLGDTFLEKIYTRFGNDDDYESYPGQVLFMMALDTCNASVQRDIAGAQEKYNDLSLDLYPGEDVTELATEALRLTNILSGSYALPLTLGTTLIKKVIKTSSEFFNRKMFTLLDDARTMETKYRLLDPATMQNDPNYSTLGPYGLCAKLQDEHGKLIADSDWPALASTLPESNNININSEDEPQELICYKCKQPGHKANDPQCPLYKSRDTSYKRKPQDKDSSEDTSRFRPKDPWKYIEPKDLTKPVMIDKRAWYFCTKCKCKATGNVGYYQLSHTDETHIDDYKPEGNLSPIVDPDSTPAPPLRLSDLTQNKDDDNDDELVFTGTYCAPVIAFNGPSN